MAYKVNVRVVEFRTPTGTMKRAMNYISALPSCVEGEEKIDQTEFKVCEILRGESNTTD